MGRKGERGWLEKEWRLRAPSSSLPTSPSAPLNPPLTSGWGCTYIDLENQPYNHLHPPTPLSLSLSLSPPSPSPPSLSLPLPTTHMIFWLSVLVVLYIAADSSSRQWATVWANPDQSSQQYTKPTLPQPPAVHLMLTLHQGCRWRIYCRTSPRV